MNRGLDAPAVISVLLGLENLEENASSPPSRRRYRWN